MISVEKIQAARILIVDYRPDNIFLPSPIFVPKEYIHASSMAGSGQACHLHAENDYVDMHVPNLHGIDVIKQVRELEKDTYFSVLAITGDAGYKIAVSEAGARAFIARP